MRIRVIGAGAAGLTAAYELLQRARETGRDPMLEIVEKADKAGLGCSFYAGGMIAPWCEAEGTEPLVANLGVEALEFWTRIVPVAERRGSLVVARPRDRSELVAVFQAHQPFRNPGPRRPRRAGTRSRRQFRTGALFRRRGASGPPRRHGGTGPASQHRTQCRLSLWRRRRHLAGRLRLDAGLPGFRGKTRSNRAARRQGRDDGSYARRT